MSATVPWRAWVVQIDDKVMNKVAESPGNEYDGPVGGDPDVLAAADESRLKTWRPPFPCAADHLVCKLC